MPSDAHPNIITLVTPWYGPDTTGGAETQARSLAGALHALGISVRVWSSTGRDSFHPDAQHYYPAGAGEVDGIPVWRFIPTPPNAQGIPQFFAQHPRLLPRLDGVAEHEMRLLATLLSSDELYQAIYAERDRSWFVFLPYPFPTTFWGALLAPDRSFLIPCLHDEPYARYGTYHLLFARVRGLLCNSVPEAQLVRRLVPTLPDSVIHVAGEGIPWSQQGDALAFRQFLASHIPSLDQATLPPILLYVGRRDESKNLPLLLAYVREYWARRGCSFLLILIGRGSLNIPAPLDARSTPNAPILDLGYLDDEQRNNAYAASDVFILPSLYESFSIVLMEAWLHHTAALVHGDCDVTRFHCEQSGGGLSFRNFGGFAAALDMLLADHSLRTTLGARGHAYVFETCDWRKVAQRTADIILGAACQ